jgi:2-polyprenyl-3-methyl-5-hydroxy-6-metoxy-1,4-benzoquinol methylase
LDWSSYTVQWTANKNLNDKMQVDRLEILQNFCMKFKRVVDIGCGSIEPLWSCNRPESLAVDLGKPALKMLKKAGFKGNVIMASATSLPIKSGYFDAAICSEVIEHLTTVQVKQVFNELDCMAKNVLVTTPHCYLNAKILDPTHIQFFTEKQLIPIVPSAYKFFTSRFPYNNLNYYMHFKSPRFIKKRLGTLICSVMDKVCSNKWILHLWFKLTHGAFLIVKKENC